MRAAGHPFQVLGPNEEETIHRNVLRIVDEVGLQVEHEGLLERVAAVGGRVDRDTQRVTFSPDEAVGFIETCRRPLDAGTPHLSGGASIYYGRYLDPRDDRFVPLTVERVREFYTVARALPHVDGLGILGCPLEGIPSDVEPLYERYWAWMLGAGPGGSIHRLNLCAPILEMCAVHAAATGRTLEQAFNGTVYLVPPLKLGYQEAAQVAWFLEGGLRVGIGGSMITGGATGPVTLAGMVTLGIAEGLLLGMLNRALFDDRTWGIWMSVTAMDFRTAMRPYGRPDMVLANLMGAQMARRYGAQYGGHCGLTDAMRPSPQAAAQKVQSALPTLMAGGHAAIAAGLLAIDEVFSPLQLVLDDEIISALAQFTRDYEVSDASIGAEVVAQVGPGGTFLAEPHTAEWFRREMWEPTIWERHPFAAWQERDGRTDVERARARVLALVADTPEESGLSQEEQRDLQAIIRDTLKAHRSRQAAAF
jgi:trimethylamine--corrinoid protein Co-methyltransferase